MLQKEHQDYDSSKCGKKKSTEQHTEGLLNLAQTSSFSQALSQAQSWSQEYSNADEIPNGKLPKTYDFRNIGGQDLTNGNLRDQGTCGACHAQSFAQVAEVRLRLKFGQSKEIPKISAQQLLSCNYMNEGCQGGWAIFNGYLAEQGYLVDSKCAPMKWDAPCSKFESCEPVAKVNKSYFVEYSSSQTAVDEKLIMKEILRNGPVVGEFKVPKEF